MRRSIYLGATVALGLGVFPPSHGFAQYCQPYWTAEYKCMNGCGCPGGGGAVQPPPQQPQQQQPPPGPSPEVLAFQRVRARMIAVIEALSSGPFLDRNSWMANLPNTSQAFMSDADNLHTSLVAQSTAFQRQVAAYRTIIDLGNHAAPALLQQLPAVLQDIARLTAALKEAQAYGPWYQAQIDNLATATREMQAQSARLRAAITADQQATVAAFMVLLPPGAAPASAGQIVEPPPQDKLPVPAEPVVDLYRNGRPIYPVLPIPALAALPDTNAQPVYSGVPGLGGSLDDRAAQLENDARNLQASFDLRNQLMAQAQPAQQAYENAGSRLGQAVAQQSNLVGQIFTAAAAADKARGAELAASDAMHTEAGRFVSYAAQAWIWQNAKKFVLDRIKVELKTQAYFKQHSDLARTFLDIGEPQVLQYYQQRKFNVMNLPDGIEQALGFKKLHDSIVTLQTHAQGYAQEATAIAAHGTESETLAFVGGVYQGIDADSKSIVQANMGLLNLPEPFASMVTKYFTKTDP
jgi:hypothetical protein